ncbi:MAG: single-stranded DNA-binding protein [Gammaproteobacteria bacterium]|nr:single-stranded DNA-binding protein [Gammaproteobacteria bacterium]
MASGSINKVILIGNLGADPEMRYTQDQSAVANLRIATSERWTDRATNERRERTDWHRVVCFRRLAEICGEYLHKGSKVYIEGQLQTRSWEGQDGQTRYMTEVVARDMQMLDSRGGGGGFGGPDDGGGYGDRGAQRDRGGYGGDQPPRSPPPSSPKPAADADDFEDDIPF